MTDVEFVPANEANLFRLLAEFPSTKKWTCPGSVLDQWIDIIATTPNYELLRRSGDKS